jgi:hypothetical protein
VHCQSEPPSSSSSLFSFSQLLPVEADQVLLATYCDLWSLNQILEKKLFGQLIGQFIKCDVH